GKQLPLLQPQGSGILLGYQFGMSQALFFCGLKIDATLANHANRLRPDRPERKDKRQPGVPSPLLGQVIDPNRRAVDGHSRIPDDQRSVVTRDHSFQVGWRRFITRLDPQERSEDDLYEGYGRPGMGVERHRAHLLERLSGDQHDTLDPVLRGHADARYDLQISGPRVFDGGD